MLGAIGRFLLFRVLGARVMLALALLGVVRRLLGARRREVTPPSPTGRGDSVYQPSQGTSQTVHRVPR
jgi:hypothetical protein